MFTLLQQQNKQRQLVGWLLNTDRSICANCGGGKLAQSAKDDKQNEVVHNGMNKMTDETK